MRKPRPAVVTLLAVALAVLGAAGAARAAAPPPPSPQMIYAGDGLTVRVFEWDEARGTVRGEIVRDGQAYPFAGRIGEEGEAEVVRGQFKVGEKSFEFTSRQDSDDEVVKFTSGGKTYRLRPAREAPEPEPEMAGDNPLAADGPPAAPAPPAGVPVPAPDGGPDGVPVGPADLPDTVRLRQHSFPDVSTGAPVAYVAVAPADWKAEGHIEWQAGGGSTPFPQTKVTLSSPQGGRVKFVPAAFFSYMNAPGLGQRDGVPAPQRFPEWLAEALPRYNKAVTNVRLVSSQRNEKLEQAKAENDRVTGAVVSPESRWEAWEICLEYDEAGVRRREEALLTFVTYAPGRGLNGFFSQTWSIFYGPIGSAPAETYAAQRATLFQVAGTFRQTVRWFTLSQQIIAENSRRRADQVWDRINRRGEQIKNMRVTKADEEAYGRSLGSDEAQRKRVQGIYETEDYEDADGNRVALPIHGKYKFTDGQGNYVISNQSQKPGESWQEISPAGQ